MTSLILEELVMSNFASLYKENKELLNEVYASIKSNDIAMLKKFFTLHPDMLHIPVYRGSLNNKGLLHLAAKEAKSVEICLYLIDCGIDVNALDHSRHTPLI